MAKQRNKQNTAVCARCGCNLTDNNCRPNATNHSGYSAYCVSCEQSIFDSMAETQGRFMGLFFTCIALDVPCSPFVLEDCQDEYNSGDSAWITYINALSEKKADTKNGKPVGFNGGAVTSLQRLFGKDLTHKDFVAYIDNERKKIDQLPGTKEQRERWGTLPLVKGLAWTNELYDELDRIYQARVSSFKGQTLSLQQELTLIRVSKKDAIADYYTRLGNTKGAADIEKSASQLLADEQMRKKDEKPVEHFRMDALVVALEKFGCMENGDFLNYDELIEVLRDKFIKSKKYDYSLDAADQVVLDVLNAMRANADLMQLTELPSEFAVEDEYGEFEPEETEEEKKRKAFAGLTKVQFTNQNNDDKGDNE